MMLDPKVAYWTGAWVNLGVIVTCALLGVRRVRRADYRAHERLVLTAAWLVLAFLVSYVIKLSVLGREQLELWQPVYVHVLRAHELCVAIMLVAGLTAVTLAKRLGLPVGSSSRSIDPRRLARGIRLHRRAGWTAISAAILGLLSASWVLWGMYARLGAA